jgi:hypothetical protein
MEMCVPHIYRPAAMSRIAKSYVHYRLCVPLYQSTVRVVAHPAEIPFETIVLFVFFPNVNHFGAGVGLLMVVGKRNRIKFAHRVVAHQHTTWVFPGNGRAGFNLCPR